MEQLEDLSIRVAGGPQLVDVAFGPEGSWPFYWYLRNYPNARFYGEHPTREDVAATAVIAGQPQWAVVEPYLGDDYYQFEYTFLWWPMEDYKQMTWQGVKEWLSDPQKRLAIWRIFYDRDYSLYDQITGKTHTLDNWPLHRKFRLYVRKDAMAQMWDLTLPLPGETTPSDPYADGWMERAAALVWGAEGSEPGQFLSPRGIGVSPEGYVYVADSQNHRIQKFTATGQFVTQWGTYGQCDQGTPEPGTFCEPWDVAVGPDGSVYVADTWAHRIQKFTPDGEFITQWGTFGQFGMGNPEGRSAFYGPRSIAVAPDGTVYVSDTGNKRVQVFDPDGQFIREWGGGGAAPGQLDEPMGVAVGPDGNIYVADTWNRRVQVLEPDGTPVTVWEIAGWDNTEADERPYLAVDDGERVYVSDPGHYRILVFDSQGTYLYSFGRFGFDAFSFALPMGVALGPDGSLYISDAASHRVMVFPGEEFTPNGQGHE